MPFIYFVIPGFICLALGIRAGLKYMRTDNEQLEK